MTKVIRLTAQGNGGFCGCDHCPSMANVSQFDADVEVLRQQLGDHIRQAAKQARDDGDRLCPWVAATAIMDTLVRIVASFKTHAPS